MAKTNLLIDAYYANDFWKILWIKNNNNISSQIRKELKLLVIQDQYGCISWICTFCSQDWLNYIFQTICYFGKLKMVDLVINDKLNCGNINMDEAVCSAARQGHFKFIKSIIRKDCTSSFVLAKIFICACVRGHIDMVKWLYSLNPELLHNIDLFHLFSILLNLLDTDLCLEELQISHLQPNGSCIVTSCQASTYKQRSHLFSVLKFISTFLQPESIFVNKTSIMTQLVRNGIPYELFYNINNKNKRKMVQDFFKVYSMITKKYSFLRCCKGIVLNYLYPEAFFLQPKPVKTTVGVTLPNIQHQHVSTALSGNSLAGEIVFTNYLIDPKLVLTPISNNAIILPCPGKYANKEYLTLSWKYEK